MPHPEKIPDTDETGAFKATFGGIDVRVKQIVNQTKQSVIMYALTPDEGAGSVYRLYEFYRLHDTGEVLLPKNLGISRDMYLWLDKRYGTQRYGERIKTVDDLD